MALLSADCLSVNFIHWSIITLYVGLSVRWPTSANVQKTHNTTVLSCCVVIFTTQQFLPRDAMHPRYKPWPCVRLCLCLSVTSRSSTKTAKRRITQTTPHDSPETLVFCCQRSPSPRNSTGVTPYEGAECRWGGSKSATFD